MNVTEITEGALRHLAGFHHWVPDVLRQQPAAHALREHGAGEEHRRVLASRR